MSKTDWNESNLSNADARLEAAASSSCQADNLKGLLNAIVSQISEADRRQSDTLNQLQGRLATMGRDARSLRDKVPDRFQVAFERIEAGMAELATRISETGSDPSLSEAEPHALKSPAAFPAAFEAELPISAPPLPTSYVTDATLAEPPVALRSATISTNWRHEDSTSKVASGVDTFDVIESLPGDVADPWDSDSATALASVYDSEPATFAQGSYAQPSTESSRIYAPAGAASLDTGIDHSWLEKRFAEISERIDASIAEIRPDQSFFALGQRLDQIERGFTQAFENVATRNDVESIRLIEAHMIEIVEHLETSQSHLARIESIEAQIAGIGERLDEIHALANAAGASPDQEYAGPASINVAAVAKAVADETAARLSALAQTGTEVPGLHDVRALLEESMSNARQSEENTSALLDMLQQAMIRLLDRMDAIEFNQHHSINTPLNPSSPPGFHRAELPAGAMMHDDPAFDEPHARAPHDPDPTGLDEAVAAVAASRTAASSYRQYISSDEDLDVPATRPEPRPSEKLRQDFIADARRAKMRLAAETGDDTIVLTTAPRDLAATASAPRAGKPAKPAAPAVAERIASAVSPRVVALSVALAVASGAYLFLPFGKGKTPNAGMMSQTSAPITGASTVPKKAQGSGTPAATAGAASEAPPPNADFTSPDKPAQFNLHQMEGLSESGTGTLGAMRPFNGVAVAHQVTSPDELERARRDHAMASLSTRLGQAAAENPAAVSPAALDLNAVAQNGTADASPQAGKRSALDLPPAMVGPLSLRLAAANGDPSAEFEVGARIAEGKGPDQNFKEAAKWYQRSASKGFAQAQYRLGTLYERGLGVKTDEARAKEWYARAAGQGNIKAMHNLAVLSANGKTGSPDYGLAANWFTQAAEGGLADSQFNLAVLYENGLGVPADMRQSYKWLSLAARRGDKEAVRRRDIMKGKLTAGELAEAEKMADAFHARPSDPMINDARTAGEAWKKNAPDQS